MLLRDDPREILLMRVEKVAKAHQHARAAQRRRDTPCRKRLCRCLNGCIDVRGIGKRHMPNDLAGCGIGYFAITRRHRVGRAPADPQRQPLERCQIHVDSSNRCAD